MRIHPNLLILCVGIVTVCGNTVSDVRLIDYESYMPSLIGETMRKVEEMEWCNLWVNDITLNVDDNVLGTEVRGRVEYINGFVVSIQWLDILRSSVKQVWRFHRAANTTTVEVQGVMRMHAVSLGFDVVATMADGVERYTAEFMHPLLQFDFTVIKDMFLDDINVRVVGSVPRNANVPRFLPVSHHSEVFASLYDWNSTTIGIRSWGSDVFQPIAYNLALNEIQFPRICYNCPVS